MTTENLNNYKLVVDCFKKIRLDVFSYFSSGDHDGLQHSLKKQEAVTQVDLDIEDMIKTIIFSSFPNHTIIGEESGVLESENNEGNYVWYVDPLDNTVGFLAGEPEVSVSVSLKADEEHVYSLIINPRTKDVFEANREGSFRNSKPLETYKGNLDGMTRAISLCSFVNSANMERMQRIYKILWQGRYPLRISGGTALDLCHVADGSRAAHISLGAHSWDVEGGLHMVKNAGGIVEILGRFPERNNLAFIASANLDIHHQIRKLLGEADAAKP